MIIYEKLAEVRDSVSFEENPDFWEDRAYVLREIAGQAFTNENEKDSIPEYVYLNYSSLTEEQLVKLFKELNLKVDVIKKGSQPRSYEIKFEKCC